MNPHADRDRSEEPTRDERVERYAARAVRLMGLNVQRAHDRMVALEIGEAYIVLADAELAEKDATIARLEAEVGQYAVAYPLALARAEKAEAALARVEALHVKFTLYEPCPDEVTGCNHHSCMEADYGEWYHADEPTSEACDECRDEDGSFIEWPCPTIKALRGDS